MQLPYIVRFINHQLDQLDNAPAELDHPTARIFINSVRHCLGRAADLLTEADESQYDTLLRGLMGRIKASLPKQDDFVSKDPFVPLSESHKTHAAMSDIIQAVNMALEEIREHARSVKRERDSQVLVGKIQEIAASNLDLSPILERLKRI